MFSLITSIPLVLYAIASGVWPLRAVVWIKVLLSLLMALAGAKFFIYIASGGFLQPRLPAAAMVALEIAFAWLLVFVFLLILKDLLSIVLWGLHRFFGWRKVTLNTNKVIGVLAALSLVAGISGVHQALKVPEVRKIALTVPGLPRAFEGLRMVQLSDLHVGMLQQGDWLKAVVDKTMALKPDLIVITGDFVDGTVKKVSPQTLALKQLSAPLGVYACPGNHEYYSGYHDWIEQLNAYGVRVLENSSVVIRKGADEIVLAGTTDLGASRFGLISPNLKAAFAGTAPDAFRVLLTHQPKTTSKSGERIHLQLSGHTHGGQVLFLRPLIGLFNDGLVAGVYTRGDKTIYVHSGTGLWNGFSVRLGVPSEITEITLR